MRRGIRAVDRAGAHRGGRDGYANALTERLGQTRSGDIFPPVDFDSVIVSFAGSNGSAAINAEFASPAGIAVDASGRVYVTDTTLRIVRSIDPDGRTVAAVGAAADTGAPSVEGDLISPSRLLVDGEGRLIVTTLDAIHMIEPGRPAMVSPVTGKAGFAGDGESALNAQFNGNSGMAIDSGGICSSPTAEMGAYGESIRSEGYQRSPGQVRAVPTATGDQRLTRPLDKPVDVAVGPDRSIFVAELGGHRIRRIRPDGVITTYAGNGLAGLSGDGGPAIDASLDSPRAIAVDSEGNLYIADWRIAYSARWRSTEPSQRLPDSLRKALFEKGVPHSPWHYRRRWISRLAPKERFT